LRRKYNKFSKYFFQSKQKEVSLTVIPMAFMNTVGKHEDNIPDQLAIAMTHGLPKNKLVAGMMELPDGFTGDIVSCGKFVSEVSFRDKI
jgi:hypothetical protein